MDGSQFFVYSDGLVEAENAGGETFGDERLGRALVAAGATLSHHHGIGQWHAPWLGAEIGSEGLALLQAAARQLDPRGILNPHVLLDPVDRLEA